MMVSVNAKCPICVEDHSEIVRVIAEQDLRRIPNRELISEAEYISRELAELRVTESDNKSYRVYLVHRAEILSNEISRRKNLANHRGPTLPEKGFASTEAICEIKSRTSLIDLLGRDIEIYHNSKNWHGRCPVHGDGFDREPSLVIYEDEGRWWCFGCNSGGDCFDWMQVFHNLSFREAVEYLGKKVGIIFAEPKKVGIKID